MSGKLKRTYFILLLPSVLFFIFIFLARTYNILLIGSCNFIGILAPSIFILSVVFAIAWPFFQRTALTQRLWDQNLTFKQEWERFERKKIYIAMVTPYLAAAGYFLNVSKFYRYGTILMGLYAAYYCYPSKSRIELERRIFRVK